MFKRKSTGASTAETVTRSVVAAGRIVAGERGARVANAITGPITGRVDICGDPNCLNCAPVR